MFKWDRDAPGRADAVSSAMPAVRFLVFALALVACADPAPEEAPPLPPTRAADADGADGALALETGPAPVRLVELYTSEGCSSCPPAEARLAAFADDPRLWADIVPVAFHVGYWDHLGWADPFARDPHLERQRAYTEVWSYPALYTPAFAVDGRPWRSWHTDSTLPGRSASDDAGGLLRVRRDSAGVRVAFAPAASIESPLEATVALLGHAPMRRIRGGENAGRTLRHPFVALTLDRAALSPHAGGFAATIAPPPIPDVGAERYGVAVWVSRVGDPRPLQAAGAWLGDQPGNSSSNP